MFTTFWLRKLLGLGCKHMAMTAPSTGWHQLVNGKNNDFCLFGMLIQKLKLKSDDLGQASHVMSSPTYSSAAVEGVTV